MDENNRRGIENLLDRITDLKKIFSKPIGETDIPIKIIKDEAINENPAPSEALKYKKTKVYPKELGEATEEIKEETLQVISMASEELSKDFKRRLRNWGYGFIVLTIGALAFVTFVATNYVNKYAKYSTEQGRQFMNEVKGVQNKNNQLENNYTSLNSTVLKQAALFYEIDMNIKNIRGENEEKFSSLQIGVNGLENRFNEYKKSNEDTMKSDYDNFLQLNTQLSNKFDGLSARLSAVDSELSKAKDLSTTVSSIDERLKKFVDEKGKLEIEYKNLKRDFEKLNNEKISKDEYKKLEDKIDGYDKTKKGLQEQIDFLNRKFDSYIKEKQ